MSLLRAQTGFELYPLTAGSNDSPDALPGNVVTFEMRNLPLTVGRLAYYLYGIAVTFTATIDVAAEPSLIFWDRLVEIFLSSVEVRNAWHGTPVSQNHVSGQMLKIIEFVGGGYRWIDRPKAAIGADGTFQRTVYIPLSVGCGPKPHHTAQLNLFYKQAQLVLNMAPATVLTAISAGASISACTVKASALILPEPEVRLGPGCEWIDYRSASSANQNQILLASFGNVTGLTGTIPDAGVLWLAAISNAQMPGSFAVENITRYTFPWRGQVPITDINAVMAMATLAQNDMMPTYSEDDGDNNGVAGYPYVMNRSWNPVTTAAQAGALAFIMAAEGMNVELTKVQTARGDQSFFLDGPTFSGTNHTLAQHLRSWDDSKRLDAVKQIVDAGIAKTVIGRSDNLGWTPKLLNKNDTIDGEKLRYLPWRLVKNEPKQVKPLSSMARLFGGR